MINLIITENEMNDEEDEQQNDNVYLDFGMKMGKHKFVSYKEKVLFILDMIQNKISMIESLNQPSFDLNWIFFVIENDYL